MKLAVLTSGGDSAGMNAAVRAIVKAGIIKGCETWIVREGYEGLVRGNGAALENGPPPPPPALPEVSVQIKHPEFIESLRFGDGALLRDGTGDFPGRRSLKGRHIVRVGWDDVRGWLGEGGTLIGTARSKSFRTPEGRLAAAHNLIKEGIDALAVVGGDGSLTGADVFRAEWPSLVKELQTKGQITPEQAKTHSHLRIVGLVGSIDNDMSLTDLTIGAPTALHRICESIDNINSTAYSHSRAFVIEVMGRHCGWLALLAAVATGADFIFIPEEPPEPKVWEEELCFKVQKQREVGKRKTIVIVAEGAHDSSLTPITAEDVKVVLAERLKLDTRVTCLGHTQRGGAPCANDRILPTLQGIEAVNALLEATPETPSYMIGMSENRVHRVPLVEAVAITHSVAQAIQDKDFQKAKSLRDPEFLEMLEYFYATSRLDLSGRAPEEERMRVGVMHVGAPAGGMNAATRAVVRYCIRQGHTALAIHNGFRGLLVDDIFEPSWLGVDNWTTRGGSELGTNRALPDIDIGAIAAKFQQHNIQALIMIGGFEAYSALDILEKAREAYPAFRVPILHIPATISNNVPVTEFSLGCDTSVNVLVEACDAIKQSASASRNRVFVVETQGGRCGYIATMGALATGAIIAYTPEEGISLNSLQHDVEFLRRRYSLDEQGKAEGRLVIKNEVSSDVYTLEMITKMFKQEGGKLFDSRSAQLGHTLQGNIPSPIDRSRAVRLALKAMIFIEKHHKSISKGTQTETDSAAVVAIKGTRVEFVPVREVEAFADKKNRRGKEVWWAEFKGVIDALVARSQIV